MNPEVAYALLNRRLRHGADTDPLCEAWRALDGALRGAGDLPVAWQRLSVASAAERAGKKRMSDWSSLVAQGYAPGPDGHDERGRGWWHPATIDAWLSGAWRPVPRQRDPEGPPPRNGRGATEAAWRVWAQRRGLPAAGTRDQIIAACDEAGLLGVSA